jgi:hypothetical protein
MNVQQLALVRRVMTEFAVMAVTLLAVAVVSAATIWLVSTFAALDVRPVEPNTCGWL